MNFFFQSLLFITIFCFYAIFTPLGNMPSDTLYSIATANSLYHGKLDITKTPDLHYAVQGKSGLFYSKYGIGYAALFVPAVFITECTCKFTTISKHHLLQLIAALTNTFLATICIILFIVLFSKLGFKNNIIFYSVILIASGSLLLPYSKINHAEIPTTLILLLFFINWNDYKVITQKKCFIAGSCISLLILLKAGNIMSASILFIHGLIYIYFNKRDKVFLTIFCVLPLFTILFLLWLNWHRFGHILNSGYGIEQQQFTTPLPEGLWGLFFSPSKSLFLFSPLIIVTFYGMIVAFRWNARFTLPIATLFLGNLIFYSLWHDWHGGWSWGPRLLVPTLILMHIFLPFFIDSIFNAKNYKSNKNNFLFSHFRFISMKMHLLLKIVLITIAPLAIVMNCLGALIWYQQIYYFHQDYTSIQHSHPIIASKLFLNKYKNAPEIYPCKKFNRNCNSPPYTEIWKELIKKDSIDFRSFETFSGFSTFWGTMRYITRSPIYCIIPVVLFIVSLSGIIILLRPRDNARISSLSIRQ